MRQRLRTVLPFELRLNLLRLRHAPRVWLEGRGAASVHSDDPASFCHILAEHRSPLRRKATDGPLQRGKEQNVARAAELIDKISIAPAQLFSFHRLVGWPSRLRGFTRGLELRNAEMASGIGGGCCQVSNLLYYLALVSGMRIVERHRHALDLFPDDHRRVPFGCGATVLYNYADLRFENALDLPVLIRLGIEEGHLVGSVHTTKDPGFRVEIREEGARFFQRGAQWWRENRIHRRFFDGNGELLFDEQVAHNLARILYDPPSDACGER